MATFVQIGETTERPRRTAPPESRMPLNGTAHRKDAAFLEPKGYLNDAAFLEDAASQPEIQPATTSDPSAAPRTRTLLRALASVLIAPILLVVALVVFLVALADFSLFRLRDLRKGHPHPKGLWEF